MRHLLATRGLTALGVAALTGAAVLLAAAPAQAHDSAQAHSYLVASTPAEGETLTELPEAFSVTANETLLDLGAQGTFGLQIRDADGGYYGDGCVSVVDATMSADAAIGDSGEYTMVWQVVSADGHPVSGEIPFTWDAPADFEASTAHDAAPVCGEDPDAAPTAPPGSGDDDGSLLPTILTFVLAALALLVAIRAARIQLKNRAAAQRGNDLREDGQRETIRRGPMRETSGGDDLTGPPER